MHLVAPASRCRLGIGRVDVTPPVGIYHRMWGAATHDRSTGVHRPLTATALDLRPLDPADDDRQVLVALDHCLLWAEEMEALLADVASRCGLPRPALLIHFGHTHAAGLMGRERADLPGGEWIAPYLARLAEQIATALRAAEGSLREVSLDYGLGRSNLAAHRDLWEPDVGATGAGRFVCGLNPEGPADDTLLLIRATDECGRPLASMVNYACHPTTLAWQNTLISPDFPGALRELVERETGAPCVFLQGASGDLGPREGFVGDPAVADRNGRQLGHAALAAWEALPPPLARFEYAGAVESGALLGTWEYRPRRSEELAGLGRWRRRAWTVPLDYRSDQPDAAQASAQRAALQAEERRLRDAGDVGQAAVLRAKVERLTRHLQRLAGLPAGATFPMPVTLWQMGEAFWVAVESELYQDFQLALRELGAEAGAAVVVLTLCNGSRPGYLPTAETYGKGIYQESISMVAPGSLERLTAAVLDQIRQWIALD